MPRRKESYPEGLRLFSCEEPNCGYTTPERFLLTRHACVHSPAANARYPCDAPGCAYTTGVKSNLTRHALQHAPMRPTHSCETPGCGRTFLEKSSLAYHTRTVHSGEGRLTCEVEGCAFWSRTKETLALHCMKKHGEGEGEEKWGVQLRTCAECGFKTFAEKSFAEHLANPNHAKRVLRKQERSRSDAIAEQRRALRLKEQERLAQLEEHRRAVEEEYVRAQAKRKGTMWVAGEAQVGDGEDSKDGEDARSLTSFDRLDFE
jgi:hypothetical protein